MESLNQENGPKTQEELRASNEIQKELIKRHCESDHPDTEEVMKWIEANAQIVSEIIERHPDYKDIWIKGDPKEQDRIVQEIEQEIKK